MKNKKIDASNHEKNWKGFLKFSKYLIGSIATILILMAYFLV